MALTWNRPDALWGLLLVPLLAAAYVRGVRRRGRTFLSLPTAPFLAHIPRERTVRSRVPVGLFAASVVITVLSVARPVFPITVPSDKTTIILSIDVSGSMRSTDIAPSRFEAAKAAAKTFLRTLPPRTRVGLVSFAGYAQLVVPPVNDPTKSIAAIDTLSMARRTAIGEGLVEAVAALPERFRPNADGTLPQPAPSSPPAGIIVLLSDGRTNAGIDTLVAADVARQMKAVVYTIGIGATQYTENTWTIGGTVDEEGLRAIAERTGGRYYNPKNADQLQDVYRKLARSLGWETRPDEVTGVFALIAAALLLAAVATSRGWVHRLDA
jgi:Ca-activated chloride channel family protein